MKNTNEILHEILVKEIKDDWVCVDMTTGHGYDTQVLAQKAQKVYAFDIQLEAINSSKQLNSSFDNVVYFHQSHDNIDEVIHEPIDCVIYNLGYLPKGNKRIKTKMETTIISLSKVHKLLKKNGILMITCYPGHAGGDREAVAVKQWMDHHQKQYEIEVYDYPTKNSPIAYVAKKRTP